MYIIIITCYWLFSNDIMAVKRLTSTETIRLIRDGEKRMWGGGGGGGGYGDEGRRLLLYTCCHHQNDPCM